MLSVCARTVHHLRVMRFLPALLLAFVLRLTATAAEPWLKPNDVVALVGREDMVVIAEDGWLETLVTEAQPKDRIRFRSLAWEGDTVFEQRRDLNYPTLEAQLDKMGATVVIFQFGKMESFAGKDGVAAFTEAYEKLLARVSGDKKWRIMLDGEFHTKPSQYVFEFKGHEIVKFSLGGYGCESDRLPVETKRRIALVLPPRMIPYKEYARWIIKRDDEEKERMRKAGTGGTILWPGDMFKSRENEPTPYFPGRALLERLPEFSVRNTQILAYRDAIRAVAGKCSALIVDSERPPSPDTRMYITYDGIRVCEPDHMRRDAVIARGLGWVMSPSPRDDKTAAQIQALETAIRAKNRLWFHYTRPQNWAFLAGNRTNQPSSRDHLDPNKRWFPEEMEQWLPLIEAKEKEIWAMAAAPR